MKFITCELVPFASHPLPHMHAPTHTYIHTFTACKCLNTPPPHALAAQYLTLVVHVHIKSSYLAGYALQSWAWRQSSSEHAIHRPENEGEGTECTVHRHKQLLMTAHSTPLAMYVEPHAHTEIGAYTYVCVYLVLMYVRRMNEVTCMSSPSPSFLYMYVHCEY